MLFPTVDANYNAIRELEPNSEPSDFVPGSPTYNLFTAQLNVSYTPDVFGGVRRSIESLQAQADSQRFALEATYLTLTSNLAGAAVQEASLRGQIEATKSIIKIETDVLGVMRHQRELGDLAEGDVVAQEAALAQVEQMLPPLEKQLAQQRDLIAALSGGFPSDIMTERFYLAALRLPRDLPVSLPSKLIEQRPDVRAAEANLQSASAQIGVAIANRLPNITLTGNPGSTALAMNQLFTPGTEFWVITGSITQPIFDGGTLFFREQAAKAAFKQAQAQYRSTVIVAFQNVAELAARHSIRRGRFAKSGRVRTSGRKKPRDHPPTHAAWRHQLSRLAQCAADLSNGAAQSRAGQSRPFCRHRSSVPGARRRLVEPAGCRTGSSGDDQRRVSLKLPADMRF